MQNLYLKILQKRQLVMILHILMSYFLKFNAQLFLMYDKVKLVAKQKLKKIK